MTDAEAALVAAAAAFIGGVFGSLVPVFLARRQAFEQALGQRYAERRIEVIERLSALLSEIADLGDLSDGAPVAGTSRSVDLVYADYSAALTQAGLYLDDSVLTALRPFGQWLFDESAYGSHAPNPFPCECDGLVRVSELLAEAIEGRHRRTRGWFGRAAAAMKRLPQRKAKQLATKPRE